jgi:alpha-ribazole phosphatase
VKYVLIRHTKTSCPEGICYGNSDVGLDESFESRKVKIADNIADLDFDAVYSSPLQRCQKLADYLFANQTIQYDKRLKELNFGEWEKKSWDEIYNSKAGKAWFKSYLTKACPGGESYNELLKRVRHFFNDLHSNHFPEENIAIVAHGGVIKVLISFIKNMPVEEALQKKVGFGEVVEISSEPK